MSLIVTAIASGSNGNCYYVGNDNEAILVDAGISCRKIENRLKNLELSIHRIKGVFISHEHTDHIQGLRVLSYKYSLPIYITKGTLQNSKMDLDNPLINIINSFEEISIGDLKVTAFPKKHNAWDPHSFVIEQNEICVGVFTDIGSPCENVINFFKKCHAIFLETNYDEDMLLNGKYPYHLKRLVSSDIGHLSNKQALELFLTHKPEFMSHIFLSHISGENNNLQLVTELFKKYSCEVEIVPTSRFDSTPIYHIGHNKPQAKQLRIFG
jgi:phosphoribosyl 1,2-cyclic phosphodiesterase